MQYAIYFFLLIHFNKHILQDYCLNIVHICIYLETNDATVILVERLEYVVRVQSGISWKMCPQTA